MQDLIAKDHARRCKHNCCSCCKHCAVKYVIPHGILLLCAEIFCHGYSETGTDSYAETQNQKLHAAGGTNTCQCLGSQDLSHDSCINNVISLLQKVSQKKRQRKLHHQLQRISLYHRC